MSDLLGDITDSEKSTKTAGAYQVLARKYRPDNFADLIGHHAMVKTLTNAFASDRIAHAYILTGVRGVGKTTTARILARALNYASADGEDRGPQIEFDEPGLHCRAIAESRHPDVLEMDAASRTGVNDIRELIEGVRYAPVEARYKVYIIDEVHMLSTAAFNALLKTLEEPPPHVKFIFATTEIRKLPVTVLSRCQRFDLRRIDPETLTGHLAAIAEKENVSIDREALWMIARAAEGSVRDALSILDQAIVQHISINKSQEPVKSDDVRDMLGLADRSLVWDMLDAAFRGDAKTALDNFETQYDAGADPSVIVRDALDIIHLLTRIKAAGPSAAAHGPAGEADAKRARDMSSQLEMNALTRGWSLLMGGLNEIRSAPDAAAAGEMAIIKLCFVADLPTPDEALKALKKNSADGSRSSSSQPLRENPQNVEPVSVAVATPAPIEAKTETTITGSVTGGSSKTTKQKFHAFQDIVRYAGRVKDAKLRTELESYVHLVSFAPGHIDLRLHKDAPGDLAGRLTQRLMEWTGTRWIVSVNAREAGAATLRDERHAQVLAHPTIMKALELFPDAEISTIRDIDPMGDHDDTDNPNGILDEIDDDAISGDELNTPREA